MILGYDEKHEGLRGFLQSIQTSLMRFPVWFLVMTRNMRVFVVFFSLSRLHWWGSLYDSWLWRETWGSSWFSSVYPDFIDGVPCKILGYDEEHEGIRGFIQSIQTSLMGFPVRFLVTTRNMRVFVVLFSLYRLHWWGSVYDSWLRRETWGSSWFSSVYPDFIHEAPCMSLGYDEKHEGLRGILQSIQTNIEIIS